MSQDQPPQQHNLRCRLAALAVLAWCAAACTPATPAKSPIGTDAHVPPTSVVLVGDSLADQAAPYLAPLLNGVPLVARFFGGTAPCDWLGTDLGAGPTSLVIISFYGNYSTPCMSNGAGAQLQGAALLAKYRADIAALIGQAQAAGARVLVVGQPTREKASDAEKVTALNDIYRELARSLGASYVDAGAAVENPDGSYAERLPCLPGETSCDPSGTNQVRSGDGVHFCPLPAASGACNVYSSGAFRFASAISQAIAAA